MSEINHNELESTLLHWIKETWDADNFSKVLNKLGRCGITTMSGLKLAVEHKTLNKIFKAVGEKGFKSATLDKIRAF